jgi:WXG100 family type VII secretion target
VRADVEAIAAAADTLDGIAEDARRDIDDLMRHVGALMERWHGRAAATHADAWDQWHTAATDLLAAIAQDAETLRAAAADYRRTDTAAAADLGAAFPHVDLGF